MIERVEPQRIALPPILSAHVDVSAKTRERSRGASLVPAGGREATRPTSRQNPSAEVLAPSAGAADHRHAVLDPRRRRADRARPHRACRGARRCAVQMHVHLDMTVRGSGSRVRSKRRAERGQRLIRLRPAGKRRPDRTERGRDLHLVIAGLQIVFKVAAGPRAIRGRCEIPRPLVLAVWAEIGQPGSIGDGSPRPGNELILARRRAGAARCDALRETANKSLNRVLLLSLVGDHPFLMS